jgi:transcription initiation factor TFIIIB Brf1 subunit/transcription initiation factor TFIIB
MAEINFDSIDIDAIEREISSLTGGRKEEDTGSKVKNVCNICLSKALIYESDAVICSNCKTLLYQDLNDAPEWKKYDGDFESDRCSMPVNEMMQSTSTKTFISGYVNKSNYNLKILHKWNAVPYKERVTISCINYLKQNWPELDAKIVADTVRLFMLAISIQMSRGLTRRGLILAFLYYQLKERKMIYSINVIAKKYGIDKSYITAGFSRIHDIVHSKKCETITKGINTAPTTIIEYLPKVLEGLEKLTKKQKEIYSEAVDVVKELSIVKRGEPPSSLAGTLDILSKNLGFGLTTKQISILLSVSLSTVGQYNRNLSPHLKGIIEKYKEKDTKKACC